MLNLEPWMTPPPHYAMLTHPSIAWSKHYVWTLIQGRGAISKECSNNVGWIVVDPCNIIAQMMEQFYELFNYLLFWCSMAIGYDAWMMLKAVIASECCFTASHCMFCFIYLICKKLKSINRENFLRKTHVYNCSCHIVICIYTSHSTVKFSAANKWVWKWQTYFVLKVFFVNYELQYRSNIFFIIVI